MNHQIKGLVVGGMLALGLGGVAVAGPLEDAIAAGQKGDFGTAEKLLRPLAESGNSIAETDLGVLYHNGWGVPHDDALALGWFRKAADQGSADAELDVGDAYQNGFGAPQDLMAAADWYRKAADQGLPAAQYNLASLYHNGRGVQQDDAQAAIWLRKAADEGFAPAEYNLGVLLAAGQGMTKDLVQSRMWFVIAIARTDVNDTQHRADAVKARDAVSAMMTPDQIAQSDKLAAAWTPK